ncbi:hypothetical protein GBL_2699 [Geobacillus kaustophilus GBlys]|uniref:Uncharacterized protein n=1 Tax=Geobacillus kaustophilus GBlys TaxID=1337888 RepID=U2X6R9_GEOKU|nr:hypothetical protein GBL_2699 [Geobacillus kaustophilus GBlys]
MLLYQLLSYFAACIHFPCLIWQSTKKSRRPDKPGKRHIVAF